MFGPFARSSVESELVQEIQSFRIASFWWLLKFGEAHFRFQKAGSLCHSRWSILRVAHILCWVEITWSLSQTHKRHIQLCFFVLFLQVLIYIYRYLFSCSLSRGENDRSNWKAVFRPPKPRSISSATTNSIGGRCTCCPIAQIRFGNKIFPCKTFADRFGWPVPALVTVHPKNPFE